MTKKEYIDLVNLVNNYSYNYHTLDISLVPDEEYDKLFQELIRIEKLHPEWKVNNSPTNKVGDIVNETFSKNNHLKKMYSLDNLFTQADLGKWIYEIGLKLKPQNKILIVSPKLDGLSLNLLYENGKLIKATTRGDGIVGENVLKNALYVNGIPHEIPYQGLIEIRGEVLMSKKEFLKLNESRITSNEEPFKTPRNAAAGSLRQLNPEITKSRNLDFIAWGIGKISEPVFSNLSQFFKFFYDIEGTIPIPFINLKINLSSWDSETINDVTTNIITTIEKIKRSGEYELDGIVLMVDNFQECENLGYTIRSPRFGIAYKFQAQEYKTKLTNVIWQVGRTGILTPVGIIEPVIIDGVTVTKSTLHNIEDIKRKNIHIGQDVIIVRSGDVIPKILRGEKTDDNCKEIIPPKLCPVCNESTTISENKVVCTNNHCKGRFIASLSHFVSRDCLNIQGLGEEIIRDLVEKCNITKKSDLFDITYEDLCQLDGYGEKKISNLLSNIELSKGCEGWKFLNSLGIPFIGKGNSQWLVKLYGLDFLIDKLDLRTVSVQGFSSNTLSQIMEFIENNKEEIKILYNILEPSISKVPVKYNEKITGKTFVITGTLSKPRETFKEIISNLGGKVTTSISTNTDYLLYGKDAGRKYEDAQQLDVACIDEKTFMEML